jgi:hypothetical protein
MQNFGQETSWKLTICEREKDMDNVDLYKIGCENWRSIEIYLDNIQWGELWH